MEPGESAPVRVGDILAGKYRVERVLGVGGMGAVVAATHLDLCELRAMKFMLPQLRTSTQAVERFLREARATVRLRGEHVVKIHDVGRFDTGEPYMVMEYLEGRDLAQILREDGPLPVVTAVDYVLQALEAVAEAHAAGIVHRDLKPGNLFLTRDVHGAPLVKVLDFGSSKLTRGLAPVDGALTGSCAMFGSPFYMPPEQMRSARDVDARADIWAVGIILYQLLLGRVPFAGDSMPELCVAVLKDEPAPPSSQRQDIPRGLDAVLLGCIKKDRAARFQSVAELA
ncbi:MAG: serine/threonine protein kinase, partial [Deltaproteobacteria bacterium]|nr:serine/threonine protein kinase [Deltaproteobacteria bacterium]